MYTLCVFTDLFLLFVFAILHTCLRLARVKSSPMELFHLIRCRVSFGELRAGGSCADLPLSIAQHAWRYREDTWSTWLSMECNGWPMGIRLHQVASNVSQLLPLNTCLYNLVLERMFLEMVGDVPRTVDAKHCSCKRGAICLRGFH